MVKKVVRALKKATTPQNREQEIGRLVDTLGHFGEVTRGLDTARQLKAYAEAIKILQQVMNDQQEDELVALLLLS